MNHVVSLIENKKAKLVLIANDVDPIELVVFYQPYVKMGVPYAIVKGKARLGTLVHKKTSAVVAALTEVNSADEAELSKLISTINANYIEKYEENRKHWGGGIMGSKANDKIAKRLKLLLLLFLLLTK